MPCPGHDVQGAAQSWDLGLLGHPGLLIPRDLPEQLQQQGRLYNPPAMPNNFLNYSLFLNTGSHIIKENKVIFNLVACTLGEPWKT